MSQENVDIVRRAFGAYERGDIPGLLAEFSADIVTRQNPPIPDARTYQGHEGVLKAIADYTLPFDEFVMTAEEFTSADDKVLVRVHQKAVGTESGVPVEGDFWFVYSVSEGVITRLDMFSGEPEAVEAAGLSE